MTVPARRSPLTRPLSAALAAALLLAPVAGAQAGRLLDALQAAQLNDPQFRNAVARHDASVEAAPLARAALLPSLIASAAADRERYQLSDNDNLIVDPTDPQPAADRANFSATRNTYALDLRQTLWDLEAFQRLRAANLQKAEAQATLRAAEQQLMLRVAEAYFGVLAAADALSANRAERDAYAGLVDQAQKRLRTGLGARIGVEEAQAFYSLTAQAVSDAELQLFDAQRALQQLTGSALPVAALRDSIPLLAPQPADAGAWLSAARDDNYSVQAAQLRMQALQRQSAAEAARHGPNVSLRGSLGRSDAPALLGGDQRVDSIGVVAEWPIFQGGLVTAQHREAQALVRAAQADYAAERSTAERETLAAFRGVLAGMRNIQAARRAVDANQTALTASRNGVEAATRTEFDLLNAQNNYYAALRAYFQSRYDYLRNGLRLKAQAGRLSAADLAAIDALLDGNDSITLPAEPIAAIDADQLQPLPESP
ncbi:MAG TPA: TolC family outer membrane protein [Fontimonas sp.]